MYSIYNLKWKERNCGECEIGWKVRGYAVGHWGSGVADVRTVMQGVPVSHTVKQNKHAANYSQVSA